MSDSSQGVGRWLVTASWPVGVVLTAWDYMWRSTPLHRREVAASLPVGGSVLLELPGGVDVARVQAQESGRGPLFHREYRTRVRGTDVSAEELIESVRGNLNRPAPTTMARFQKVYGAPDLMTVGDEYVVRMAGPWDGPVRVIDVGSRSFRFATLAGHLEAGQIEFRANEGESPGELVFEIESWARSSSWLSNLLYHRVRIAKEVQAHMWISFLEGVVALTGGRMTGGIELDTQRVSASPSAESLRGAPRIRRRLEALSSKPLNFDLDALTNNTGRGWEVTDLCTALAGEPRGMPVDGGSWEIARRLMRGYEFADPSIVRAYYDPDGPLEGRNMLLKLQVGFLRLFVGVRVGEVYEDTRQLSERQVHVWGWNYRTLDGHVEAGQMDWEVWKWLDTGAVEFRVHAVSRTAPIINPFVWAGYRLLRRRARRAFLRSTQERMRALTDVALDEEAGVSDVQSLAARLTAGTGPVDLAIHQALAENLGSEARRTKDETVER